jgi:hypothetical protein
VQDGPEGTIVVGNVDVVGHPETKLASYVQAEGRSE